MSEATQKSTRANNPRRLPSQHAAVNARRFPWARALLAALLAVVLFVGTSAALIIQNLDHQVKDAVIDISHLTKPDAAQSAKDDLSDSFAGRAVNILVVGIDSRYGENADMGAGSTDELDTIHSDTTMILHLSADRTRTTVTSIPRDMMTDIPSCILSDGSETYPQYDEMFNSAFTTGAVTDDIAGGIACTQATVEQMTGLNIDGFVILDFAGLEKVVDALGGVEICIDQDIYDYEGFTDLDLKAGCQKLDGHQGLAYARARYVNVGDGSDLQRIDRQQKLVGAIITQALNSNFFTDLPSLYAFIQEALHIVKVSSSLNDLRKDAGLLNSLRNTDRANFRFVTMPWAEDPDNANRVIADEPQATEIFDSLINDTPLPIGTVYRDLDNHRYIIADDGSSIMIDEEGNHVILDQNGQMIPSPDPAQSDGSNQNGGSDQSTNDGTN